MNCKAIDGLIRYLTRVIPDGLLLSIAHVRFTWFNKCKRFAGLNFKCKLEVGLIIKTVNFFQDEAMIAPCNNPDGFAKFCPALRGAEP